MTQQALFDTPSGIRSAVVIAWGVGTPPKNLIVSVDGVKEPCVILAPPKDIPSVRAAIAVREGITEHGARYWAYAGDR